MSDKRTCCRECKVKRISQEVCKEDFRSDRENEILDKDRGRWLRVQNIGKKDEMSRKEIESGGKMEGGKDRRKTRSR
jgi:hypothetical protein